MPIYRSGIDMLKKYTVKFNPTVIGTRFTDVKELALDRANEGLNWVATVRSLVRPLLDENGITGGLRATYLAFATELASYGLHQAGDSLAKIATGLKSKYVTGFGLDPAICDKIIGVVVGWTAPY